MAERTFIQRHGYTALRVLCRLVAVIFFSIRCQGRHNMPREGAVLICSNHQSYFDPVLVGLTFNRRLNYLARQSLFPVRAVPMADSIPRRHSHRSRWPRVVGTPRVVASTPARRDCLDLPGRNKDLGRLRPATSSRLLCVGSDAGKQHSCRSAWTERTTLGRAGRSGRVAARSTSALASHSRPTKSANWTTTT